MGSHTLRDLFGISAIPSICAVGKLVESSFSEPELDLAAFSKFARNDPGLVCTFVRSANAKLNSMREVSSVHQAIHVCGQEDTRKILDELKTIESIPELNRYRDMFEFGFTNCISQALAAESLKEFGIIDDESSTFLTGILSDMGVLALMQTYPEEYHEKVWVPICEGKEYQDVQELEHAAFGFSHVTVGHELGRRWRLGEAFSSSILQHHQEINGGFYSMTSQAAHKTVDFLDCKNQKETKRELLEEHLRICFQLTDDDMNLMIKNVEERRQKVFQSLNLRCVGSAV